MSSLSRRSSSSDDEAAYMIEKSNYSQQRLRQKRGSILSHIGLLVAGIIVGILTAYTAGATKTSLHQEPSASSIIPDKIFSPRLPTVMRPDERYVGWSSFVNQNWHYLIRSSESVFISEPEKHNLGPGFASPFSSSSAAPYQFYHVSNLHQLHCLNILRIEYYHAVKNVSQASADDDAQAAYHFEHCLEYLRQGIMCGDNFEIEGASPAGSPPEEVADAWGNPLGWGVTKNCVNWDNLMSWQRSQFEMAKSLGDKLI